MPLLWLSLAFLLGILLAAQMRLAVNGWLALAGVPLALCLLTPLLRRVFVYAPRLARLAITHSPAWLTRAAIRLAALRPPAPLLLIVFCLGAARYQSVQPDWSHAAFIGWHNDRPGEVIVEGLLVEPPDVRDGYTNLRVAVERLRRREELLFQPVEGLLLVKAESQGVWRYGDRLRLQGELLTPPEDEAFSYRQYLARRGIYAFMEWPAAMITGREQGSPLLAALYRLKAHALATVYRIFPDPEASLLAGVLLGVDSGIPAPVYRAFQDTGTAHIIAISGFNVTLLAGVFSALFGRVLGRWRGALAAALAIAAYTLLAGAAASAVRAALMGGLSLLAAQLGRRQDGLNSLAFTAACMALVTPQVVWDVGFQLSFAATLGLVLYAEPLQQAFLRLGARLGWGRAAQRLAGPVGEYFLLTFAAQVTTLPLMAYYFQRLSLTSLLANPLILPAQPPLMILGGLALMLGMVYLPLGQAAAWLAWPFGAYTIRMVELLGRLRGGVMILGESSPFWLIAVYALLLAVTFAAARRRVSAWLRPGLALSALAVALLLVWRAALAAPDGRLHLTLLPVSTASRSGEALLIETPGGRYILIGGGPSASLLSQALGRRLPPATRGMDAWLVADPAEEQVGALPRLVERYSPGEVVWAGPTHASTESRALQAALNAAGVRPVMAQAGQAYDLGEGARLRVLRVSSSGATLLLEWRSFRALLPLGMDFEDLQALQAGGALTPLSAYLLAEGGLAALNPPEWLRSLGAQVILLSVSPGDRRGLPDGETLEALRGYTLLRTDQHGWIELTTDGERMWVEVEER